MAMIKMWQIRLVLLISIVGCTAVTSMPTKPTELSTVDLVITAYQSLGNVRIDGLPVSLTNADDWSLTDHVALPAMSRLIAVEGLIATSEPCAGVLASVNDTYLLTNSVWKCSEINYAGWTDLGFDDSAWPNAVEYGSNGNHATCTEQKHFPDISSNAQWIWSSDLSSFTVYCRGYLPLCQTSSPCQNGGTCLSNAKQLCNCPPEFTGTYCESELMDGALVITAYQELLSLYIDGQQQSLVNGNMWNQTDRTVLTKTNRLIAVSAEGNRTCGGILASFGADYVLSNSEWKCSRYMSGGWMNLGFDDSSFQPAIEFGSNGGGHTQCSHLQTIPDISYDAMWIWEADQTETTIFCRGYLPVCDSSPCQNNGTCLQNSVQMCNCLPQFTGTYCETKLMDGSLVITSYQELLSLYIDGQQQSLVNGNMWNQTDRTVLTKTNRLIAVSAEGDTTCGGILASFGGDYVLTNSEWKCSKYQDAGWMNLGFVESEYYLPAVEFGSNGGGHTQCSHLQVVPDISYDAMWIWDFDQREKTIFCRGYIPVCDSSPCRNNGTCLQNDVDLCQCLPQFTGTYCETDLGYKS